MSVNDAAPQSFLNSKAHQIVNPRGHAGSNGARTTVIRLPAGKATDFDHEQILAAFFEGFFGGWVFGPERLVLQLVRRRLVHFSRAWYMVLTHVV